MRSYRDWRCAITLYWLTAKYEEIYLKDYATVGDLKLGLTSAPERGWPRCSSALWRVQLRF